MKILLCHNFYRLPGGEDHVYRDECWLLERFGHEVIRFERDNQAIGESSQLKMAKTTFWSDETYKEISQLIQVHHPDIVHFHNTFPLISPSGYYAARRAAVPVVQTMHNFRTICPGSTLLRDNAVCEKCITKPFAWPSVVHKCYRDSRAATAVTAVAESFHRLRGTRHKCVDRYIALTNHSRETFIKSGLPAEKICVKPNFVRPDPGPIESNRQAAVFVGRLSTEKGIETLLDAWRQIGSKIPLKIIGDGPLSELVLDAQQNNPAIEWLGQIPFDDVLREIGQARVLVCPSIWYETFGRSMIEAFATGTPVVASNMGSMKELVSDGKTGFHFRAGDSGDLAEKVAMLFDNDILFDDACKAARREYEQKYTAETNYEILMAIYRQAIAASTTVGANNE